VGAGAPIAATDRFADLSSRFVAEAAARGRRALFFGTEQRFVAATDLRTLLVGEQPVWDPQRWRETVAGSRSLREQLRRAMRKGVTVRQAASGEVADASQPLRRQIEALIERWLATRPLAAMGFLVDIQPFSHASERRYFVAERDGQVVGFLAAVPVYAREGWLFEDLLRSPEAANGTVESLVDLAMRVVADDGSRFVTLGLAPLAGTVSGWLGVARRLGGALYDFSGVQSFRARLRPTRWDPIYLSFPGTGRGLAALAADTRAILDVLSAFARGSLASFGLETLLRGPAFVLRLLGLLLLPWTVLLAVAPARFFPGSAVRWAWVLFDVLLAAALVALAWRWRRGLAAAVAVVVTADAVVTAAQVALHNAAAARGPVDSFVIALSVAMPAMAAVILWKALGRRPPPPPG
jgi:phosphatidylglycerol lysyltransferase